MSWVQWCIWINNAVGLYNTRWFLAFLGSTTLAAFYGAVLSVLVVRGDMRQRGAWSLAWVHPETGRLVRLGQSWRLTVQYVVSSYAVAAGTAAFLGIATWIVFGFTAVQVWRGGVGVTTNEAWKRKELASARDAAERAGAPPPSRCSCRKVHRQPVHNAYDRGWRRNFSEVMFPKWHLTRALSAFKTE